MHISIPQLLEEHKDKLTELENILGYIFKDKTLLLRAITSAHYNYIDENDQRFDYEALEFLGDRFVNILEILEQFTLSDAPVNLHNKHFNQGVTNKHLSYLAEENGLIPYMLLGKKMPQKDKPIADVMEAIFCAILIDDDAWSLKTLMHVWQHMHESIRRREKEKEIKKEAIQLTLEKLLEFFELPEPDIFILKERKKKYVGTLEIKSAHLKYNARGGRRGAVSQMLKGQLLVSLRDSWIFYQKEELIPEEKDEQQQAAQ